MQTSNTSRTETALVALAFKQQSIVDQSCYVTLTKIGHQLHCKFSLPSNQSKNHITLPSRYYSRSRLAIDH